MLAVIFYEAATDVTPELLSLPVTLLGCDRHLSSMEPSTSHFTPVTIAIRPKKYMFVSDLLSF